MIDWSKPVRAKGTKEIVRVLAYDLPRPMPVVVFIPSNGYMHSHTKEGRASLSGFESPLDLENVPEFDASKPGRQRNGRAARIVSVNGDNREYPIIAIVETENGKEVPNFYTKDGRDSWTCSEPGLDLINV